MKQLVDLSGDGERLVPMLGHNNPPAPTPFEQAEKDIGDLYEEARLWLDGATVDSKELADGIGNLLSMLRAAEKRADEARTAEKKPFDEQIAAIQARYAPLIGNTKAIKGKTVLATEACKRALQPWLEAEDRRQREEARKAREEADRIAREAREAYQRAEAANLAERAAAEALLEQAKKAERLANRAEKQTATAGGAVGRAAALRTVYTPVMTDATAAARHYWLTQRDEMAAFLQGLAERDVRSGKRNQDIPGFDIKEERIAV